MLIFTTAALLAAEARGGINVQVGNNFTAATLFVDANAVPPDSNGAIGPLQFTEFINGRFSVFDKVSGVRVQTLSDVAFWNNAGITFAGGAGVSDPRIVFDPLSGRWFASQIDYDLANLASNRFLLAVSVTNDATGAWRGLAWQADPGGSFTDYPRLGLDAKGVYLTGNQFSPSEAFLGVLLTSIPKADLLLDVPTVSNRTCSGVLPVSARGFTLQPVLNFNPTNNAEFVLSVESDGGDFLNHSNLFSFTVSNADTATATFSASSQTLVPNYFVPLNPPQPDGLSTLDDGDVRIGGYVVQVGDDVYATHAVEQGTRAVVRWYRLGASDHLLRESGTISDTNLDLFYPSLAVNPNGVVVIGFNGTSTNTFVSSYAVAGRTINGQTTFGGKVLLKAGVANYQRSAGGVRWGDYSTTTVDAANPSHFWTIQEFPSAANIWSTQVTELIVTETPPVLNLAVTGNASQLSWPTNEIGFSLQSTTNAPGGAVWSPVTNAVAIVGDQNVVTTTNNVGAQFFRLIR